MLELACATYELAVNPITLIILVAIVWKFAYDKGYAKGRIDGKDEGHREESFKKACSNHKNRYKS